MLNYKRPLGQQIIESYVHASATLGARSTAWWYSRILAEARIGNDVMIGGGTEIGRGCVIGDGTRIQANCFLPSHSQIGRNVFIGPGVVMTDDRHPYVHGSDDLPYTPEPPVVEDDAVICAGVLLIPGIRIGRGAFVAAGAVVTRDVPAGCAVKGNPAKPFALSDRARVAYLRAG